MPETKAPVGMVGELPAQKKKGASKKGGASPDTLREAGNELFRKADYGAAVAKYAECIAANPSDAAALANRAECYLRVRQFHLALVDATASLAADPSHVKSLYKKAMALNGLGRYAAAIKTLKELLAAEPEDLVAKNALAECQLLQEQAFLGKYDMPALLFGRLAMSFRRCADHVGPVKVAAEGVVRGRGVVTTRAVKAGELLVVSSPLAVAPLATGAEMALVQGLMGAASRNPQDLAMILALPADANADKAAPVPDMANFRRHLSKGDEALPELPHQEIFARHAANVVKTSAIRNASSVGVYALPSFVNHSCAPNACKLLIGHTMFIHAARDLAKGEEVFVKYFDVTMPKPDRATVAKRWGFACECARCKMEAIGEDKATAMAEKAAAAAKAAREAAVKDAKEKRKADDRDGEKAAAVAAAAAMEGAEISSVAALVTVMRAKAKMLHHDIAKALEQWKRTKGKSAPPDPNQLVEIATWFESQCDALGLDATQAAWARTSVLQVYSNINHCFTASGQMETRAEILEKVANTLALTDPASFEHCKQVAVSAATARRAFHGKGAEKLIAKAEDAAVAVHCVRYGLMPTEGLNREMGQLYLTDEDEAKAKAADEARTELVKRTEAGIEEGEGEFCEA